MSGFEVAQQGDNGYVCLVMRGFSAPTYGTSRSGREILPFVEDAASSRLVPNAVVQLNQTIIEPFNGV